MEYVEDNQSWADMLIWKKWLIFIRFLGTVQRHQDQYDKGQVGEGLHQVLNAFSVGQKNIRMRLCT